ncbi:hypothetical protein C4K30_2030 [Pseudomonas chlororaphis subsp. piscium]|nr:hypothetical protein C4K30_2030 [Pseudomonas chlororaphis subsp. piscium]
MNWTPHHSGQRFTQRLMDQLAIEQQRKAA